MQSSIKLIAALSVTVLLAACGSGLNADPNATGSKGTTTTPVKSRDGEIYRQEIPVAATGDTVVVQVFEPTKLEAGKTYPLVLQGHGYGGSRNTTAPDGSFIKRLMDAGYYVISIDERGFGESSGTVRVMDPEFEGLDLVAVLDWAEKLEGLRRGSDGKMVVGSYGGSYGGMYQFLLMGSDQAKQRLHIIAPDITPHDLTESLNLNNVVKSGYGLALTAGGESSPRQSGPRQDPVIEEILISAVASNAFSESANNFFKYHSVAYFCDGKAAGAQSFNFATPDQLSVPAAPFPAKVDAMITQGFRDTLFNFNQSVENYQCLSKLGGDVRLLTHESGHILPVSLTSIPGAEEGLDPFYAALTFPNFQDAGGARNCGKLKLDDVLFAWLEEKLQGKSTLVTALPSGKGVCLSLGKDDAVTVPAVTQGGTKYDVDASTPQFNSALGVGGALLGNGAREALLATQVIPVPAGAVAIAGVPTMSINLAGLSGQEQTTCPTPLNLAGCDPILFLGIGLQKAGTTRWDLIDDQLTPIRGFDTETSVHAGNMSGIAERLAEGDKIALLIYGFHAQYPVTWSRDLLVPAVTLTGSINLPFLKASDFAEQVGPAPEAGAAGSPLGSIGGFVPVPGGGSGGLCAPGSVPGIGGQCSPVDPTTGGLPSAPSGGGGGGGGGTLCAPGSVPGIGGQCSPVDPTTGGLPSAPSGGGGDGGTLCAPGSVPGIGGQCSPVDPTTGGLPSGVPSGLPSPPSGGGGGGGTLCAPGSVPGIGGQCSPVDPTTGGLPSGVPSGLPSGVPSGLPSSGGGPVPNQCDPSGFAPDGSRCLGDIPGLGPVVFSN